ncbi:uncharacterized protein LOC115632943 [Scaptodrosophila lebanonensis]|uniref:Uncharacterized protein LOC115632943 n=1 Tax=Drosophila lebanonensis TaxID=7225 RepID=A0A6J2UCI0_DROLE|nr:uncharacterized protein LOC115632943 [Scaptodrosophila lebanonensis]
MNLLRKLRATFNEFFYHNYPFISICSCSVAIITAYLHYEWKVHKYDLMYWKQVTESCSHDIDYFQLLILLTILFINVIFVGIVVTVYLHPLAETAELTLLEIKDRYARFILLRLIARLDRVHGKLSSKRRRLTFQHYARAHSNMVKAVALFRKDARKLILPNESEIVLPIEEIYGVTEDEERALRRGGYYKLPIDTTDEAVRSLFNPK